MSDGLFEMPATPVVEEPKLSPDRRRTQRQAEAVAAGRHPLGLIFPTIARHPDTKGLEYSSADPRTDRDLTCGSCAWRERNEYHGRVYAKCGKDGDRRVTNGAGSDIRAWWPGCSDWEPVS